MKLYVWRENFLTDYTSGMGIAVANSIAEAREQLLSVAEDWEKSSVAAGTFGEPEVFDLPAAAFIWGGA